MRILNRWTALVALLVVACVGPRPSTGETHRWWKGLGPVLPHETFPGDCKTCHVGTDWSQLAASFRFDHKAQTGVPLEGAHQQAQCLRCHNDRGPVAAFQRRGCVGCHQDVHQGTLGSDCKACHDQLTWLAHGQVERHERTRFPLSGAHAGVACARCHAGGLVGRFVPSDSRCETCHQDELQATSNPPHIPLGWSRRCDKCHLPTRWKHGTRR